MGLLLGGEAVVLLCSEVGMLLGGEVGVLLCGARASETIDVGGEVIEDGVKDSKREVDAAML